MGMDRIDLSDEKVVKPISYSDEGEAWYGSLESKPEIEQILHRLQSEYYDAKSESRKKAIFSEMFGWINRYAKSLFLKKVKGGDYVEPDIVEDKAIHAALAFMSQYINRPGFRVGASFGGMLEFKVREAKFKEYADEHNLSLNAFVGDEGDSELEDIQERAGFKDVFRPNRGLVEDDLFKTSLNDAIDTTLEDFDIGVVGDPKFSIAGRMWLAILLRKPRNKHGKGQFLRIWGAEPKMKRTLQLLELTLYQRLRGEE
jgi:hypothetical protein